METIYCRIPSQTTIVMKIKILLLLITLSFLACKKKIDEPTPTSSEQMYYPPNNATDWETKSAASLGWKQTAIDDLKKFLVEKNSKSFMILVNGRIVLEEYFNGHSQNTSWQWNSAGKTLVATTTGLAQQEGLLNINTAANQYLGTGWTSEPLTKENLISVRHLLTMTSGLDESSDLVIKSKLTYVADAGTRWAYANVFQKLMDVVSSASKQTFESYFDNKLKNKIGMDGFWDDGIIFKIYNSNTRSMARFGLFALNNGKWNKEQIISESFFSESIKTSQNINPSYGYLWWLNGKSSYMIPGSQNVFQGNLIPSAPSDMYAAMGASDQRIYVIPSKNMVIVRMGNASDPANPSFAVSGFDESLWQKINAVIN